MKRPVGVGVEFLVTFIEAIDWQKEGFWIRDVNRHRHIQSACRLPHFIKAPVVYFDERPGLNLFAKIEAQRLKNFQSLCSHPTGPLNLIGLKVRIIRYGNLVVPWLNEDNEAIRMRYLPVTNRFFKQGSVAPGQIYHYADILTVHHLQDLLRVRRMMNHIGLSLAVNPGQV